MTEPTNGRRDIAAEGYRPPGCGHINRRTFRAAYLHAFFWGAGTGLFSAHLLRYLVRDLCHGPSTALIATTFSWIIAAPRMAGLFRLLVPALMDRFGNRKIFCIVHFLAAPVFLGGVPLLIAASVDRFREAGQLAWILALLVLSWSLYHIALHFGTISLFSWYGDLVPASLRGRFWGRREAWFTGGMAFGYLAAGLYSYYYIDHLPEAVAKWTAYRAPAVVALAFFFLSLPPLLCLPEVPWKRRTESILRQFCRLGTLLTDRRFAAFVAFGCWVQMSQALTQGVQNHFSIGVLGISMLTTLAMSTTTRIGQWGIGPVAGKLLDRFGSAPVMMTSLILAATGSLFYYFAQRETWWLLFGAAVVWIFWVGVNVGISKTILDLAPEGDNTGHLAVYFTLTSLAFALFTILGGHLIKPEFGKASFLWSFELRLAAVPMLYIVLRGMKRC